MGYPPGWSQSYVKSLVTSVIDCCGNIEVTNADQKVFQFWNIMFDEVNINFDELTAAEITGKKDFCLAQNFMDLHHLLLFLQIIDEERTTNKLNGNNYGSLYYIDKYCIIAIRDKFYCKGYTVQAILKVFELFDLSYETTSNSINQERGIGYMSIQGDSEPIFRSK